MIDYVELMRRGLAKRHGLAALENLDVPRCPAEGIEMFAVCSKKESKTTPGLKEVRHKMFKKKFDVRANRYLADLRRQQMIE